MCSQRRVELSYKAATEVPELNGKSDSAILERSRHITRHGLDGPGFETRYGREMFLFNHMSIPSLRPTQTHIQWVPAFFFQR
jgi:hypothetical protein